MKREVKQSLRKALSIALVFASLFVFGYRRWVIGVLLLVAAYFVMSDPEPPARPPREAA